MTLSWKLFVVYFMFDNKLPGHKTLPYLKLTALDIYVSVVVTSVLFVQLFDIGMIAHGLWILSDYRYICQNFIENKITST